IIEKLKTLLNLSHFIFLYTVSRTQHTTNEFQKARVKLTCFLYGFKIQESGQSTSLYNYKK
ncbi:hypothetical protein BUY50_02505, partial [Staphylococcus epidermidis]